MKNTLILLFAVICSCLPLTAQKIQLIFRYDDFRLKTDTLDEQLVRLFQKYHIPLTLGVIPCNEDEKIVLEPNYSFFPELKKAVENGSVEIALHGLNHIKLGNGEFGNVDKEEQYRRMKKGKEILDSIFSTQVVTFIPPWNAYDENTLEVMSRLKMKGISSALCVGQPFSSPSISYFPNTIEELKSLPMVIQQNKTRSGIIVVMLHHYDFNQQFRLSDMETILLSISNEQNVRCKSFQQLYKMKELSNDKRMRANLESNLLYKSMHLKGMIQTTFFANSIRILNVLLYIAIAACLYFLSLRLFLRKRKIVTLVNLTALFIFLMVVGVCVWFQFTAPLKLVAIVILLSVAMPPVLKRWILLPQ